MKVIQCLGGHQIPDRKKYADCNTRIMNIVQNYPDLPTLEYLRRIAYNLLQKWYTCVLFTPLYFTVFFYISWLQRCTNLRMYVFLITKIHKSTYVCILDYKDTQIYVCMYSLSAYLLHKHLLIKNVYLTIFLFAFNLVIFPGGSFPGGSFPGGGILDYKDTQIYVVFQGGGYSWLQRYTNLRMYVFSKCIFVT